MDALLRTLPPGNDALAALLQRNDTNTGALMGLLTPARSHALLATPGVGAAAIAAAAAATAAAVAGAATPWTLHDGVWLKLTTFLTVTTRHCTCADDALSGALLRHLPFLYAPGAAATGAANPLYRFMLPAMEAVLYRCVRAHHLHQPLFTAGRPSTCAPPLPYLRHRLERLRGHPLLARWALDATALHVGCVLERKTTGGEPCLLALVAAVAPRQLLSADARLFHTLLGHVDALLGATRVPAGERLSTVTALAHLLEVLALVHVAGFRAVPTVPRTIVGLRRFFDAASLPSGEPLPNHHDLVLRLLMMHGAAWGALADTPDALAVVVEEVTAVPGAALTPTALEAVLLASHVGVAVVKSGRALPPLLVAARPSWTRIMRDYRTRAPSVGVAAGVLARLADPAAIPSFLAAAPADRVPDPSGVDASRYPCVALHRNPGHCWECGALTKAGSPWGGRPHLSKCAACRVALYCSSSCSAAAWTSRHGRVCAGWAAIDVEAHAGAPMDLLSSARRLLDGEEACRERSRRAALLLPSVQALGGDWRVDWGWTRAVAASVEGAGLGLADVVCVADVPTGAVALLPVEEYRWWSDAVPNATLGALSAKHDGRVLRVILRTHPPVVRSFGPRSLGLVAAP